MVGVEVPFGLVPLGLDNVGFEPWFAVSFGLLNFCWRELGGVGNATFDAFGYAAPHGFGATMFAAPGQFLSIVCEVAIHGSTNVGVNDLSRLVTGPSRVGIVDLGSLLVDGLGDGLRQVKWFNVARDFDWLKLGLDDDFQGSVNRKDTSPVDIESRDHW